MRMKGNSLQNYERQDHFGIRKLTIGAASVLLGTTLWLTNANEIVHADENENSNDSEPQEADKSDISTPVINDNTKVQVEPQNNQSQSAIESNEQNKETQAASSVNEKAVSSVTTDNKQISVDQGKQNIAGSNDDKIAKNGQVKVAGQNAATKAANSSAQKADSVLHQQAQIVQKQINQGTDKAIQGAQSNSLQLQENKKNNEPDWQKIDLTKGGQVSDSANIKVAKTGVVINADLQNYKSNNQVINHHDYKSLIDKSDENGSLINSAKKSANSGSSLNKVKQIIVEPENQQETNKTDPLNLLTANFKANKKRALSLADKALANQLLFGDSKVSDDTESDTTDNPDSDSDNQTGTVTPTDPGKPIYPEEPADPENPTQPTSSSLDEPDTPDKPDIPSEPDQPTNAPSDQKVTDTIVFTDVTTGNNLKNYSVEGIPGEKVNDQLGNLQTVADAIKTYINQGYTLVSNDYQDTFGDTDQVYTVHLAHKVETFTGDNPYGINAKATVTRQVNYTVDGVADSMLPSHTEAAHLSATGHYDLVEHKVVDIVNGQEKVTNGRVDDGHLTWTVDGGAQDSSTLTGYAVPTKNGYHVNDVTVDPAADKDANADDTGLVHDLTVNHNNHNVTITINLTKDAPAANVADIVNYIDDTTGQTLRTDNGNVINTLTGKPNGQVTYTTGDIIKGYESQGYRLVSNDFNDGQEVFGDTGKTYNVHLGHKVETFTGDNLYGINAKATVIRQVNYTVDGVADSTLPSHTETANFSGTGHYDLVEHKVVDMVNGKESVTNGKVDDGHLTWTVDGGTEDSSTLTGYAVPIKVGYHVNDVTVDPAAAKDANANDTGLVKDVTVNHNSHDVTVTINLMRNINNDTIYVDYHDEQGQAVGNRQVITGPIGQTISVETGVPDGWQVKPNTPFNYDFEKDYTLVTVTVDPVQAVINPDEITPDKPFKGTDLHNENNADVIPGTKNKHITGDITYDDLHKEVQRSIVIVDPNGAVDKKAVIQTVDFKRNATINAVTGKITFGQWQVNGKDNFKAISVPTFKGYTASQKSVAAVNNVGSDFEDPHLLITYKANDNQQNIKYENTDGQVIANQVVKGKTDQNVTVKADIPDGWQLAPNEKVPSEVKVTGTDTIVKIVPVESQIDPDTITPTNPLTTNDILPGTTSKHPKQDITYQDLHKDVTRTITIKNPDGTNTPIIQTVHFSRPASVNAATGNITFGQWTTKDGSDLPSIQVPVIPGYTASQSSVAAVNNVTADYSDPELQVIYTPDEGQQTINYTDDQGNLIATQVVKGKTNQKITLSPRQIDGYHVVKSSAVPNELTIKAQDQAVNVIVVPNTSEIKASDVTPTRSIKSTDVLPGTTNKHAKQDITYNDLHKAVSRQITVTLPSGQKQTIEQVVHFQRNASVNDGTGEVNYGQWQTNGNNSLAAVNLPQVSGYLATGHVPAINNVNSDDQNQQLNISYIKDTPANRLKIAAANLAASQSAQEADNKRLAAAKKNQELAHQAYEANQKDLQKQSALVSQLNAQALSAKAFLTSLMADNGSSVAAKKARESLAALMAKVVAANQRIEQDQQAISKQKDKATQAQSTIDSLVKKKKSIGDQINQLEKDMPEAAQVLDELKKQKGYQINLNQDYIEAVSQYVTGAKKDYDKSNEIKDINDDANLNNSFHQALENSGQGILANMAKDFATPGAINLQEEKDQIDLSKILSAENSGYSQRSENKLEDGTWDQLNKETTFFAFNLLNEVRDQLGLPELTLNGKTMDLAEKIAQNYVRDGRSHYNTRGHDAKAVNDAASANDLDSVSDYKGDDPYNSHEQYYESLDGGSAQNRLEIVVPEDNGNYGITFVVGPKSQNSYETNLDSVKQVIFTNLLQMLINDGATWGHTIQLLNIGPYQDYNQTHPVYRFGASMHLLPNEFNVDNLAKYTNHYIVVPPQFIEAGKEKEFARSDRKNVPKDTFNPVALTKQQQKYLDEANELANLKEEKASIEQQIRQQSLARDGANDLVNKLQNDLKQAQSEKDGLNGQQTNAQNKSKEADEKLAAHEQAVKDAQNKLAAAQKAAQEAEAKKEEMERKADAGKIQADESDQEVKNQTSQSEQRQQQTKDAALVYQQAQNTGTSGSNENNPSNTSAKEDNGSGNNSAAKNEQTDSSAGSDANGDEPDEPDQSDDNDDDSDDEADKDNSASSVNNNGVHGESSMAARHGNVYNNLVHSAKSQNSQAALQRVNSFHEESSTLPQTGERENNSVVAALAGAATVSISLIGLAGVRKRKRI